MEWTLFDYCISNDVAAVQKFIDEGGDVDARNYYGNTALCTAVLYGHFDIVRILIDNGAGVNMSGYMGNTPLMIAVYRWDSDEYLGNNIVGLLLEHGADVDAINHHGVSVFDVAKKNGMLDRFESLLARPILVV